MTEETFRDLVSVLSKPRHLLLFWLAWDIGENIGALLQLTKRDLVRQLNEHTREPEYLVYLAREKIKRSRRARSEPTLYPETVRFADMVLPQLGGDHEHVFPFGYRQALKVLHAAVRKTSATTRPNGQPIRWKDLRSGMACHLLRLGWSSDEVNARLGHTPRSEALSAYINYLALDRVRPKKRLHQTTIEQLQAELRQGQHRRKLIADRLMRQQAVNTELWQELRRTRDDIDRLKELSKTILASVSAKVT